MSDRVYYAVGDIHGEADRLATLHDYIVEDAARHGAPWTLIHVGDFVDRGPDSRSVIERVMLMERSGAFDVVNLKGNHEALMVNAFDRDDSLGLYHWASNGGEETIASYIRVHGAREHWREVIDPEHIAWMRALPTLWRDEERKLAFVHAGIDPKAFPSCSEEIRLWTRAERFFDVARWPKRSELEGLLVVHGHTPTQHYEPELFDQRINVDTGACYGGKLTSVVLAPGERPRFLYA